MDPVAHTLVGAAVARVGPARARAAPLALATCLIGANLPDVDIASYAAGSAFPLAFRRGWTHGALAVVVLPLLLTAVMLGWDRMVRRRRHPDVPPAEVRFLLPLAFAAVLTHPTLDLLNVYGIRLLMPFAGTWFYGDVLFIVDPWLWSVLALGLWLGRRDRVRRIRVAAAAAGAYILLMTVSAVAARWMVWRALPFARAGVERLMVAPEPLTPFRRWVVLEETDGYRVGTFDWLRRPAVRYEDLAFVPRGPEDALRAAARTEDGGWFLTWARFPFVRREDGVVHLIDARYALEGDAAFGALTVEVAGP